MVESETHEYIRHRLAIAGGDANDIFETETLSEIHRLTSGIPRLINTLCDTALTACMVENRPRVTLEVIDNVVHELRWQWFEEQAPRAQSARSATEPSADGTVSVMAYRSGQLVDQVEAHGFPFVIGRGNANDLVIIDKEVSRRHALIDCIGGIYVVEDLNSKNGILVNQKRRARALLRSGDIISLGEVDVVFYVEHRRSGKPLTRAAVEDKVHGELADDTSKQVVQTIESDTADRDTQQLSRLP
jgi:pSer/pThr/pTyr-binding forkhead associated (FHA) protein